MAACPALWDGNVPIVAVAHDLEPEVDVERLRTCRGSARVESHVVPPTRSEDRILACSSGNILRKRRFRKSARRKSESRYEPCERAHGRATTVASLGNLRCPTPSIKRGVEVFFRTHRSLSNAANRDSTSVPVLPTGLREPSPRPLRAFPSWWLHSPAGNAGEALAWTAAGGLTPSNPLPIVRPDLDAGWSSW